MITGERPVPEALRSVLARWDERGRPQQRPFAWQLRSWRTFLPQHAEYLDSLPNPIDRSGVAAAAIDAAGSPDGALRGFLAAMVWGYGRVGYGPFRAARILADNPHAADTLMRVADRTRRDGGPAAFEQFARTRLTGLGVAFATKYLHFCSVGREVPPAPILDRLVRRWLATHAGWRLSLNWHVADYRDYAQATVAWGAELNLDPSDVEYLMFAGAVTADSASQWAGAAAAADDRPTTSASSSPPDAMTETSTEQVSVLEALDEAEEAFAASPQAADPYDAEDFERGIRQLRRIVLSRQHALPK